MKDKGSQKDKAGGHDNGNGLKIKGDGNSLLRLSSGLVKMETTEKQPDLPWQVFAQLRIEPGF
jgi:hypothetical protein